MTIPFLSRVMPPARTRGVAIIAISCAMLAACRAATAAPFFFFLPTSGTTMQAEAIGDPGGTNYSAATWPAGIGLPTAAGGWPTPAPGFVPDVSFGNLLGISGYHTANLHLSGPAYVQFEFMGKGDADFTNHFLVSGTVIYTTTTSGSNPTAPLYFGGGLLPFSYVANVTGTPTYTIVNGSNTANPVTGAAFFLGFDPYTSGTTFTTSGTNAVYIGLSDRPEVVPDHDFQDLSVRVTIVGVPEPGAVSLAIIGVGAAALAVRRRRRGRPMSRTVAALAPSLDAARA